MNNIALSVVMPVYNTGIILQETIDSVLNQTFTDWELLIVDDGSTDEVTANILLQQNDERIRIIHKKNAGVAEARNTGLANARGKYVAFLDHDDLFVPEKLLESLKVFSEKPDAVLVYSDTIPIGDFFNRVIPKQKVDGKIFDSVIKNNPILSMSCSVVDKTFLDLHNIKFDPPCVPCDDWDFHLQCALYGRIYSTNQPLVKYRYHDNNLSSNAVKMYYAGISVINKYNALLPELSQYSGLSRRTIRKSLNHIAFKHYYGLAFEYLKLHQYKDAFQFLVKAFTLRPMKCIAKVLRFAAKSIKNSFAFLNRSC